MSRYELKYELRVETRLDPVMEEDQILELANEFEQELHTHLLEGEHLKLIGVERKDAGHTN